MQETPLVTILLIDDDEGHTELVRRNLLRCGINNPVVVINSGSKALDFVFCRGGYASRKNNSAMLILLDINMPLMDGKSALREIRADAALKHVPVIILTTSEREADILEAYQLGVNAFISKPVGLDVFVKTIVLMEEFWLSSVKLPSNFLS